MTDKQTKGQRDKLLKALAEGARIRENDSINRIISDERTKEQKAFDAHLDEMAMNHEFKPRPDSFKREMVAFEEIHRFLYSSMSDAIKNFPQNTTISQMTSDYIKSLSVMEDKLTPAKYFTLEAFYNWIERGEEDCPKCEGNYVGEQITAPPYPIPICKHCIEGKINKRTFGDNNYNERYKEWLLTLPGIEVKNV